MPLLLTAAQARSNETVTLPAIQVESQKSDSSINGYVAGIRYVGESYADNANALTVPSVTLVDAAIHYEINGWRAALNVANLFDKVHVASCSSAVACYCGDRLRTTASLSYTW